MKKRLLFTVMAALCLNFSNMASAQTPINQAVDVTTKGIQIGQKIPDNLPALAEFKGKLIILDFWATWCSPCVAMIPKMEALQKEFKDQIQIIQVTYQSEKEVIPFLKKLSNGKPSQLPQITGDKELHRLFPHIYLPHYVWIDRDRTVKAITDAESINIENISKMLNDSSISMLPRKRDMKIEYDKTKPFLINTNGGSGDNMIYHSVLTSYAEGIPFIETVRTLPNGGRQIFMGNATLKALWQKAYTTYNAYYGNNRTIIEAKDNSPISTTLDGEQAINWLRQYAYCFELIIPPHLSPKSGQLMQEELFKLIPNYTASVQKRKTKCYALIFTGPKDKLKPKGIQEPPKIDAKTCSLKGSPLSILLLNLNGYYQQNSKHPLVDLTEYEGPADLTFNANMNDLNSINEGLKPYNLKFEEQDAELDMLVITDRKQLVLPTKF